jgi:glycerol-3-phosphate dehydrogenase (NAD(P)+)
MSNTASTDSGARVAVMGSGSWGTAFALVVCDAGNDVTLWARRPELANKINIEHCNPDYFPDLSLPASLKAVSDPQEAMIGSEFVVLAVPSQALRRNLSQWRIPENAIVVSLAKGIELGTGLRMSEVIAEAGSIAPERIAVVTGPNLAREIAERQPSASVVASVSLTTAEALQTVCHTARFPGVHQHRCHRLRARRGDQERDRAGGWHGDGARPGSECDSLGDHPRAGRNQSTWVGVGSRPLHLLRPGGSR